MKWIKRLFCSRNKNTNQNISSRVNTEEAKRIYKTLLDKYPPEKIHVMGSAEDISKIKELGKPI